MYSNIIRLIIFLFLYKCGYVKNYYYCQLLIFAYLSNFKLIIFFSSLYCYIPIIHSAIKGIAIKHIVIPLPSGAIITPKITKINAAYRKFFRQNVESISPVSEIPYIMIGNSKVSPNAIKNRDINEIKSLMLRNVSTPRVWQGWEWLPVVENWSTMRIIRPPNHHSYYHCKTKNVMMIKTAVYSNQKSYPSKYDDLQDSTLHLFSLLFIHRLVFISSYPSVSFLLSFIFLRNPFNICFLFSSSSLS